MKTSHFFLALSKVFLLFFLLIPSTQSQENPSDRKDRDLSRENLFTGDASTSFPIGGVDGINMSLLYNSNVHRTVWANNTFEQPGWVGVGWTLTVGSIVADINNTRDVSDDHYYFVGQDETIEILWDDGAFKLKNYRFWTISRTVDGSGNITGWTIITENGTKLRFGNFNGSGFVFDYGYHNATRFLLGWNGLVSSPSSTNYSSAQYISYQWDLCDIEDIYGNHTTINYQMEKDSLLT